MGKIVYLVPAKEEHTFNHGFILNEDALHAIERIICEHFPLAEPKFNITENFRQHYQLDLKHVLQQENDVTNKISKICLEVKWYDDDPDCLELSIDFKRGEKVHLALCGYEADTAHTLFCELKEYIEKRIIQESPFVKFLNSSLLECIKSWLLFISLSVSSFLLYKFFRQETNINASQLYTLCKVYCVMWLIPILNLLRYLFNKFDIFSGKDYFLFGKEKEIYNQDIRRNNKIISWLYALFEKRYLGA